MLDILDRVGERDPGIRIATQQTGHLSEPRRGAEGCARRRRHGIKRLPLFWGEGYGRRMIVVKEELVGEQRRQTNRGITRDLRCTCIRK